jgi:hypothetical protein
MIVGAVALEVLDATHSGIRKTPMLDDAVVHADWPRADRLIVVGKDLPEAHVGGNQSGRGLIGLRRGCGRGGAARRRAKQCE